MNDKTFRQRLETKWGQGKFVCVGLDSEFDKIPSPATKGGNGHTVSVINTIAYFNRKIVEATEDLVCAYKPNFAFYMAQGKQGLEALRQTILDIRMFAPTVPVILDAKFGDIGNTNAGYVKLAFEYLLADAVTIHSYLGQEAMQPFLDCKDKGIFVLCRTSNPGAGEFQDCRISTGPVMIDNDPASRPLYQIVAQNVAASWNRHGNCGLVVGATYPGELKEVRGIVGDMPILIPGIGVQGGDVEKTIKAGGNSRGQGMIINSSRGIIFASNGPDFAEAARRETLKLHTLINQYRQEAA